MSSRPVIPSYDLYRGDELALPFLFIDLKKARDEGTYNAAEAHRHNYFELFYFVQGGGTHDIDFRSHEIQDHSLHIVTPGQVHLIRRSPESHGYILLFTTEFYALDPLKRDLLSQFPIFEGGAARQILQPSAEERPAFLGTITMIRDEFRSDREHREEMLRSYLNVLLVHARRILRNDSEDGDEGDSESTLLYRLRELIERNFTTCHAPNTYAEMLNISQNHLNSIVRKMLGRTIGDLVHDRIILEAKRMLAHTELSVKEIAYQLNYEDPSYFTRFFRNHAKISPNEFRENVRKKHR